MDAPLLILYGSQTGNAQDVAERLAREAQLLLFKPRLLAMDAYDVSQLPQERLVLCIASTTGQGDPPDNMKRFWRFLLRKSLPANSLSVSKFAVFGLGDSGYPQFNVAAKKLARRLESLGAAPVCSVGLGDDQHPSGYEAALDTWSTEMWAAMRRAAGPLPSHIPQPVLDASTVMQLGQPKFQVTFLATANGHPVASSTTNDKDKATREIQDGWQDAVAAWAGFRRVAAAAAAGVVVQDSSDALAAGQHPVYGPTRPYFARLIKNERITATSHFQDTRHLEFDLGQSGITYQPGDVLAVLPRTPASAVDALLQRLGLQGDALVEVRPSPSSPGGAAAAAAVACTATVRALLQGALDIAGASPRRYLFQVLAHHATTDLERERLQYFASADGRDDLYRYCAREGRTVLEVLNDFKSCNVGLHWLLEACPPLTPRLFSIASSYRLHPGQVHLTVALVEYTTPFKRKKAGLCSSYLAPLQPDNCSSGAPQDCVAVWVEQGKLRMPSDLSTPLLMIGPGTGVAPFRSFLQDRLALVQSGSAQVAACSLFVGCRSAAADYYYADEWQHMQQVGVLHRESIGLVTAFSRDQSSKVYVTDRLREHAPAVWALLQQGACVYVSGSAQKMPAGVVSAFQDIVRQEGGMSADEAVKFVRDLELKGRYHVEAWS